MTASLLEQLIDALRVLPGVGQKSAQRMAYHGLERQREGGRRLAEALAQAVERIGHCRRCRDFSETDLCPTCSSGARDAQLLCVVESPADRLYFVLQGRLSPLDGIGPRELGLDQLAQRMAEGEVQELIVATNPTVEGEATAHYLAQLARAHAVHPSRLAHGVPLGGELEYVDRGTLSHAFGSRSEIPKEPPR